MTRLSVSLVLSDEPSAIQKGQRAWRLFRQSASFAQKMTLWMIAHVLVVLLMLLCAKWAAMDTEGRLADIQWAFVVQKQSTIANAPVVKTWAQSQSAKTNTTADWTWAHAAHKDQRAPWASSVSPEAKR